MQKNEHILMYILLFTFVLILINKEAFTSNALLKNTLLYWPNIATVKCHWNIERVQKLWNPQTDQFATRWPIINHLGSCLADIWYFYVLCLVPPYHVFIILNLKVIFGSWKHDQFFIRKQFTITLKHSKKRETFNDPNTVDFMFYHINVWIIRIFHFGSERPEYWPNKILY